MTDDDQAKSDDTAPAGDAKSASPKPAKATKRTATGKTTPKKAATDKSATDKRGSPTGSGEPSADDTKAVEIPEGDATAPIDRLGGEDPPTQRLDSDVAAKTASASGSQTDTTSTGPAS